MNLVLKDNVSEALEPDEAARLLDSLEQLSRQRLAPDVRFNVTRVKNALCERPAVEQLEEP